MVQRQGLDRILVELPGVQDPGEAQRVLGSTATLEFHMVDQDNDPFEAQRRGRAPLGSTLEHKTDNSPILLRRDIIASGDQLVDATFQPTTQGGGPGVAIRLDATAARKMLDTTIANVGRLMAVLYIEYKPQLIEKDGKQVPGPPLREQPVINDARINGVFSNRFEITGLSAFEGRDLALLLRSGSLAAPISVVEQRTIGPSLGQDNIDRGIRATIVGYLLVVLFIGFYYRMFGILADIALAANLVMLIALMSRFGFQLSLPGIAGIVLTVGMAVDANVLIFERIREELNNGNSPQASIRGFDEAAHTTIDDSNLTTLIAAVVLFMFASQGDQDSRHAVAASRRRCSPRSRSRRLVNPGLRQPPALGRRCRSATNLRRRRPSARRARAPLSVTASPVRADVAVTSARHHDRPSPPRAAASR